MNLEDKKISSLTTVAICKTSYLTKGSSIKNNNKEQSFRDSKKMTMFGKKMIKDSMNVKCF